MAIAGVDLGAGRSPTGIVVLDAEGLLRQAGLARPGARPEAIARLLASMGVKVAAVDAPLRPSPGLRPAERLIAKCTGTPMLPQGFPGMRRLASLGAALVVALGRLGIMALETYPAAAARVLRVARPRGRGRHVADALLAALAGLAYHRGEALGALAGPDLIIVPAPLEYYRRVYEGLLPSALGAGYLDI